MVKTAVKNLYDLLVVLKANLSDDELEKEITQIESSIKNYGGTIVKTDDPVRRRLTHKMAGNTEGTYVAILFNSPPELPNTLKRTLSIADNVLRYIIVRKEN